MLDEMRDIVEKLKQRQQEKGRVVAEILKQGIHSKDFLEGEFLHNVAPKEMNLRVAGVDSSVLSEEFMTADLLLIRSMATIIDYRSSKKKSSSYHPSLLPRPEFIVREGLDAHEVNWHKSISRLNREYSTALEVAEKGLADLILMDGSLIPLAMDKPSEDSQLYEDYSALISNIVKLFSTCSSKGIGIVGISKDSRGKRLLEQFRDLYGDRVRIFGNDVSLLHLLMPEATRTSTVSYEGSHAENKEEKKSPKNPVLRDLEKAGFTGTVHVYYQRISSRDKPIRIETLEKDPSVVSGIIHSLSSINKNYTYPAVLIDVDLRAKLEYRDMERMIRILTLELVERMRRRSRPFR